MESKSCIIIFSHADNIEKKEVLKKAISQLKKLDLPILLSSHLSVEVDIQDEIDFLIFDRNNITFKETDFFDLEVPITEANFNKQYFFGGISTRTYVRKETYQASVFNHFISSANLADTLGFENALITEYDYVYSDENIKDLKKIIGEIEKNEYEGFFIPCQMAGINTIFPIPMVVPIKKFKNYCGTKVIKKSSDYVDMIKFKLCEQWARTFFDSLENAHRMNYDFYMENFKDSHKNLIEAGDFNPTYSNINSGIFINRDDEYSWVISIFNGTTKNLNFSTKVYYLDDLIFSQEQEYVPQSWFFSRIPREKVENVINGEGTIKIEEVITFGDVSKKFEHKINKKNYNTLKKCKWCFFY
jgi:hypothetical protein